MWRMHWSPLRALPLSCPGDSAQGRWLGPTTLGAGPTARSPRPPSLSRAGAAVASVLGRVGAVAHETLGEVSSCDERRSRLGRPLPPVLAALGTGQEPLPGHFHPLSQAGRGGGRAPALSKSLLALPPLLPAQCPGIRGPPEWTRPPPIICWKVQRRRGGRSPRMAPGPSGRGCPTSEPLPSAAALSSLSCPLLLYLETTCCNKS